MADINPQILQQVAGQNVQPAVTPPTPAKKNKKGKSATPAQTVYPNLPTGQ